VCPTEVLAFQNCLDEFKERNTNIVFVSVDTKHSLWHWQNVPRQYGGLGQVDIALLSDPSHKMSKDYGVLIEKEGICLRGMFILDDKGIVQHVSSITLTRPLQEFRNANISKITLNNVTVGRSVLEALRLLEAFQAVDKHGVLCPIDWKPSTEASETLKTISNTLIESYDERLANLQKEFGDTPVTDLDAVHKTRSRTLSGNSGTSPSISRHSTIDESNDKQLEEDDYGRLHPLTITISHTDDCPPNITTEPTRTSSAPASTTATPIATTPLEARPGPPKKSATCGTARHSEGL
jgi:peroxiredoxin (alkyl hydroperoxide reductase subunit C)